MKKRIFNYLGFVILFTAVLIVKPNNIKAGQCIPGPETYFCGSGNRVMYCAENSNADWEEVADCSPGTCSGGTCLPF